MSAHARREAFVEHGVYRARSFTYGEIVERSCACAAWMQSQNLRGERVIIWMPPGAAWAVAFYGCILSGAIAVPIDAGFSEAFVARVREKTGARLVVTGDWGQDFPAAPQFQPVENARDDLAEIVFTSEPPRNRAASPLPTAICWRISNRSSTKSRDGTGWPRRFRRSVLSTRSR